ncbi:hypothetical protein ISN45_At02g012590 [Arabidopsis thaliana x Arabidopsis arenosa]|uniref:Uncharacterized protein n=2 Tax=Arabidopsis TaxID=3701 RepID=A0A178VPT4_ARATH|nr:hypothetical protein ISN45_At02g012590 [Arabidopsis thaliana x Arabidopsis arenosa]OAP08500.1 hypothetical protein AXX17_AT2G14280 [Arabidopsis thaliana]
MGEPPNKWNESNRWVDHSHVTEVVETLPEKTSKSADANLESLDENHKEANEEEGANETMGVNEQEGANETERSDLRLLKRGRDGLLRSEGKLKPTDRCTPSFSHQKHAGEQETKIPLDSLVSSKIDRPRLFLDSLQNLSSPRFWRKRGYQA